MLENENFDSHNSLPPISSNILEVLKQIRYASNYYEVLGVEKNASFEEIKKSFHSRALLVTFYYLLFYFIPYIIYFSFIQIKILPPLPRLLIMFALLQICYFIIFSFSPS
jgi:uncharacterized membrane protein (DUF485 family)